MQVHWTDYKNVENVRILQKRVFLFHNSFRILFHNMETDERIPYMADALEDNGDGVQCVAGHQTLSIFAFAELISKPRLIVKSYPSFGTVAILQSPDAESYLSLCFSDTDHLIALTGINAFCLEVWNWRTMQLLGKQRTDVLSNHQTISCVSFSQLSIIQHAKDLNHLKIWSLNFCLDVVKVTKVECNGDKWILVKGYEILRDDLILIYDPKGGIFLNQVSKRIVKEIFRSVGEIKTISSCKGGFLCSTQQELTFFSEAEGEEITFIKSQSIPLESPIIKILPMNENTTFAVSEEGKWNTLSMANNLQSCPKFTMNRTSKYQTVFKDFLILIKEDNSIEMWDLNERKKLKSFLETIAFEITSIIVDSLRSLLFIGTSDSKVLIYQIDGLELELIQQLFLSDNSIIDINFTESFVICSDNQGYHFIVRMDSFEILSYISHSEAILKLIPIESPSSQDLELHFFNQVEGNRFSCKSVEIFKYNAAKNLTTKQSLDLQFQIASVDYLQKMNQFIVNPYLTRGLKALSIEKEGNKIKIQETNSFPYESKFKYLKIEIIGDFLITFGLDGELTILNRIGKTITSITISHRLRGEIKEILTCPKSNYILARDSADNLIALKMDSKLSNSSKKDDKFRPPSLPHSINKSTISWLESRQHKNLQSEMQNNKQICQEITLQMEILRKEIRTLLDENESKPADEKLPIQQFNLNESHHLLLHQEAQSADMDTKRNMLQLIEREKQIQRWLMDNCWHPMQVKSTLIRGIFWNNRVENFSILQEDKEMTRRLKEAIERFRIEVLINSDVFQPFAPIDTNQLEKILSQEPTCRRPEEIRIISKKRHINPKDSGTTTERFVTGTFPRYNQMEVVTYQQCHMEELFGFFDVLSLKNYFNGRFNKLQDLKFLQMKAIKVKNERLQIIQSELNDLARLCNSRFKHKEVIIDPEFSDEEKPERILHVSDEEMTCKPFQAISQRTQRSDEVSEEDVVQEIFSSAFRDKCLQTMMDGVLEIRWEDEIKKTPSVPVALQARKDLRDYDEHDLRAVKEYEEKLKFLGEEREKYKEMLSREKGGLMKDLQRIIESFNGQLSDLIELKIDVEMALNQENFKLLRNREFNRNRIEFVDTENGIKAQVLGIKKDIGGLTNFLHELEKKVQEFKVVYDSAEVRDRQLEKQFKNNFAEVSSHAIVDQAYKFFKRRSRWTPKPWTTAAIFNDMSRRILSRNLETSGAPLHDECFEFLNTLEQNDQLTNCPNIMDERLWELLCRMRRSKVESEFKVRALNAQLSEAQLAEQGLSKEISCKKMSLVALDKKMTEVREKKQVNMINRTVQLVVKRGAIEVDLSGRLVDFEDAILISKAEVDDINNMIRRAGAKKLAAMNNAAIFRRKVLHKEWEHQVLKMKIRDMRGFVKIVEKCKITKDVQRWLTRKQKGRAEDVSQVALNKEIDAMIGGFEKELLQVESELKTICRRIHHQRANNNKLDTEIESLNFEVNQQQKLHDPELEENIVHEQHNRLSAISERTRLMRKIQKQHAKIVELSALLELQRLRTYPTLKEFRSFTN